VDDLRSSSPTRGEFVSSDNVARLARRTSTMRAVDAATTAALELEERRRRRSARVQDAWLQALRGTNAGGSGRGLRARPLP
jgi:hypothetical protein